MRWTVAFLALVLFAGCGADDPAVDGEPGTTDNAEEESSSDYRVTLGNAITDTLRGRASFGQILDQQNHDEQFVIRLASRFDFAGGVVIARGDTTMPEEGTFELTDSLSKAGGNRFMILYREGMLRDLRSVSGSLTFETVTDTLISGKFDATLRGYIADRGRDLESGEVHAVGRFRAERGAAGYIIGL